MDRWIDGRMEDEWTDEGEGDGGRERSFIRG